MKTTDLSDLLHLTPAERIQLAQDLWDSIEDDTDAVSLSQDQIAELERRSAEHERDPSSSRSWDEVRTRLRDRFGV